MFTQTIQIFCFELKNTFKVSFRCVSFFPLLSFLSLSLLFLVIGCLPKPYRSFVFELKKHFQSFFQMCLIFSSFVFCLSLSLVFDYWLFTQTIQIFCFGVKNTFKVSFRCVSFFPLLSFLSLSLSCFWLLAVYPNHTDLLFWS